MIITPFRQDTSLRSEASPLHPAESDSAPTSSTLKKRNSSRKRPSSSLLEDSTEHTPVQEELEVASWKLIQLTQRVQALKNRPSTMKLSSPRWTSIWKKRIALYILCKELHHTCSSDNGTRSDSDPASSGTSLTGQNNTYDPRHWRPSGTAVSSLTSSPRSEARSPQVATPNEPPPAHEAEALSALTEGLCHRLSFHFSDPEALNLCTRQQPPQ